MSSAFVKSLATVLMLVAPACNDSSLSGTSGKRQDQGSPAAPKDEKSEDPEEPAPGSDDPESGPELGTEEGVQSTTSTQTQGEEIVSESGSISTALATCLKEWPDHPFNAAQLAAPDEVTVDQSNNNNGISHSDDQASETPRLVMITVASKNVNAGTLELLDPKGWYCVDIQSKAANNFKIRAACKAIVATLEHSEHVSNGFAIEREPGC